MRARITVLEDAKKYFILSLVDHKVQVVKFFPMIHKKISTNKQYNKKI